jgi:hypothetical protein
MKNSHVALKKGLIPIELIGIAAAIWLGLAKLI